MIHTNFQPSSCNAPIPVLLMITSSASSSLARKDVLSFSHDKIQYSSGCPGNSNGRENSNRSWRKPFAQSRPSSRNQSSLYALLGWLDGWPSISSSPSNLMLLEVKPPFPTTPSAHLRPKEFSVQIGTSSTGQYMTDVPIPHAWIDTTSCSRVKAGPPCVHTSAHAPKSGTADYSSWPPPPRTSRKLSLHRLPQRTACAFCMGLTCSFYISKLCAHSRLSGRRGPSSRFRFLCFLLMNC